MTDQPVTGQSTTEPFLPERKPWHRRVWFWIVLGVLALPVLAVGAFVVLFLTTGGWSAPDPEPAATPGTMDCAEAMRSAGFTTLPVGTGTDGTYPGAACASGGSQDPYVTIDFVAPQHDVDVWLRAELPETELLGPCGNGNSCLQVRDGEPDALANGWALNVGTTYQGDGTVAVAVKAFSM